ncbi:MAG: PLDc N-terminal domain-containing protein [Actinomycetota bacterium]|nr:PLDc N-terminal domain-containing protein [Actinomycetota bacterium]
MDNLGAALGGILVLLVFLAAVGFWIWSLVDAIRVDDDSAYRAGSKVLWVLVIALTGFVGSIVYVLAGRPRTA